MNKHRYLLLLTLVCLPCGVSNLNAATQASSQNNALNVQNASMNDMRGRVLRTSSSGDHHQSSSKEKSDKKHDHRHHHRYYVSHNTRYECTPHLHRACHLFLTSELLYWKTKEDGWDYTFTGSNTLSGPSTTYGKIRNASSDFRIGYRNAIKHEIDNSRWDLNLVWTSYHNNSDQRVHVQGQQNDAAAFLIDQTGAPFGALGARARWSIDFNAIDFEVGYNLGWKSRFAVRPFGGIKLAKIRQKIDVTYLSVLNVVENPIARNNVFSENRYTSHNYGLRVGLDSQFNAGGGFKIFLNAAAAAIWGHFNLLHQDNVAGFPPRAVYHNSFDRINTELELKTGIGWQAFLMHRQYYLDFRLAWEEQIWLSQNHTMRSFTLISPGQIKTRQHDLSFSGPTFSATFGF